MPIDPYDVADSLDLWLAFEFLSPDLTYLGAAVFIDSWINVWPTNEYRKGIVPVPKHFHPKTVILNRGFCGEVDSIVKKTGNFTFAHECSHLFLHQDFFNSTPYYSERSKSCCNECEESNPQFVGEMDQKHRDVLPLIERQANRAASAFLMPRQAVKNACAEFFGEDSNYYPLLYTPGYSKVIWKMAELFGVNFFPMMIRLRELNIISEDFINQFNTRKAAVA